METKESATERMEMDEQCKRKKKNEGKFQKKTISRRKKKGKLLKIKGH